LRIFSSFYGLTMLIGKSRSNPHVSYWTSKARQNSRERLLTNRQNLKNLSLLRIPRTRIRPPLRAHASRD
jgi:hypothetical protein